MSGKFHPIPLPGLVRLALAGIRQNRFMGIPGSLFYRPHHGDHFKLTRYGQLLETPVGVAAGPHTQLALNIVAAWLCGARYIELKTVQTLDELEVSKPCIDMQDEGYNCEWSQELKVDESFREYLHAWIIIHILRHELGFSGPAGTLFNMSVGYNLEGILNANVQWFFSKMLNCSAELAHARNSVREIYPDIDHISIPSRISDHVTLSTMHGCPPGEIEKIGLYLIREKKLHTTVKLNPTLLGAEELRGLLNTRLGFTTIVPDSAFDHDLKYGDALKILRSLDTASVENGLQFGVKLTNTLESENNKDVFDPAEKMMYMSGRALHPVSISLARKLQNDLDGSLDISFSAGADCFNIADIIACGMKPVTVCSDLLKPGGYGRLYQYIENLRTAFGAMNAESHDEYISGVAGSAGSTARSALKNLNDYADRVVSNPAYHKNPLANPSIKTARDLGWFDCIHAPCTDTCPTNQDVPAYMHHTAASNIRDAFEAIFRTNPFPSVTGMICDHLCQLKCTRINYDEAVNIRDIKRFVAEQTPPPAPSLAGEGCRGEVRAAIIGAGPAGLSCAWFLRQAGFGVDVFEQKKLAGGMVAAAIPSFRLTSQAVDADIARILASGIRLHDDHAIDKAGFDSLQRDFDVMFLAAGAQKPVKLKIDGIEAAGVLDPLEFLFDVREKSSTLMGKRVVIIGGGNTAMDAARTAFRLTGKQGTVTIVYRRTVKEMPADIGEVEAVIKEGITILELTSPESVRSADGRVTGLICSRNVLSQPGSDGRLAPVIIPGSEFEISCDTIIPAVGQELAIDFLASDQLKTNPGSYKTRIPGLYIGGDALRGASTAINAIADGRKAAAEILGEVTEKKTNLRLPPVDIPDLLHRKALREYGHHAAETALDSRRNFDMVISTLTAAEALKEASRCLLCDEICNVCVTVCPNLANFGYQIEPVSYFLEKAVMKEDGIIAFEADHLFRVDQQFQVLNIRDLCNECGNCTTFCPGSGRPFSDKPGICLSVKSLNEEGTGFFLSHLPDKTVLIYKEKDHIRTLTASGDKYVYETEQVIATINADNFSLQDVRFLTPCVREFHFDFAAEMSIILQGAMQINLNGDM